MDRDFIKNVLDDVLHTYTDEELIDQMSALITVIFNSIIIQDSKLALVDQSINKTEKIITAVFDKYVNNLDLMSVKSRMMIRNLQETHENALKLFKNQIYKIYASEPIS